MKKQKDRPEAAEIHVNKTYFTTPIFSMSGRGWDFYRFLWDPRTAEEGGGRGALPRAGNP